MKKLFLKKTYYVPVQQRPLPSLGLCLLMDFLGYASFAIPIFGELLDFIWAPISAIIFWKIFGFRKGFFGGMFNFFEEIMPGLDFIPTFTINWMLLYFRRNKEALTIRPFIHK
ncbi:MAG: hypothetical protein ICV66_11415 [Chitinophagaceae bacterium]|nr:hypothetical protein [Chitinophagaceae bacterium]